MRPGPLTVVTQRLHRAQVRLQLLTRDAMNRRRTPAGPGLTIKARCMGCDQPAPVVLKGAV